MTDENQSQPNDNPININKCPAAHGKKWLVEAWGLFKLSPWAWIASVFVMFMILIILLVIPVIGLFATVVSSIFLGGLMLGCLAQKNRQPFNITYLFKGFEVETAGLMLTGLIYLGGTVICSMLAFGIASLLGFQVMEVSPQEVMSGSFDIQAYMQSLLIPLLLMLLFLLPLLMAFWFAPALIVLRKAKPVEAFKLSFRACNKNMAAFLIYGLYGLVALVLLTLFTQTFAMLLPIIALPVNLILNMALMAVIVISIFTSVEDIFGKSNAQDSEQPPEEPSDQLTL